MRILFVCTGNLCRSPLAEHLCRRLIAAHRLSGVEVVSAGLIAVDGLPAAEGAVRVGAGDGLDLSGHRARRFDPGMLSAGDLVLAMEDRQQRDLIAAGVDLRAVRLLGEFAPGRSLEVADPFGGPDVDFQTCLEHLRACIEGLVSWIEDERLARA